ncbi:MAG: hypothetical protein KAT05_14415 [Spirochaetes bacterium]|nr:hypothetical protein [Spirochaetota bacterium]
MKIKTLLILFSVVLLSISAFADVRGRDVMTKGEIKSIEGNLKSDDGEWLLEANGKTYEIHLGPEFYREKIGLQLKEDESVKIHGYVYENDIAPIVITYNDKEYLFRDKDGRPLWAGKGKRDRHGDWRRNKDGDKKHHD